MQIEKISLSQDISDINYNKKDTPFLVNDILEEGSAPYPGPGPVRMNCSPPPSPGSQSPTAALWCGLTEVCLIEPINLLVTEQSTINILRPVNKLPLSLTITKTVTEPISYI